MKRARRCRRLELGVPADRAQFVAICCTIVATMNGLEALIVSNDVRLVDVGRLRAALDAGRSAATLRYLQLQIEPGGAHAVGRDEVGDLLDGLVDLRGLDLSGWKRLHHAAARGLGSQLTWVILFDCELASHQLVAWARVCRSIRFFELDQVRMDTDAGLQALIAANGRSLVECRLQSITCVLGPTAVSLAEAALQAAPNLLALAIDGNHVGPMSFLRASHQRLRALLICLGDGSPLINLAAGIGRGAMPSLRHVDVRYDWRDVSEPEVDAFEVRPAAETPTDALQAVCVTFGIDLDRSQDYLADPNRHEFKLRGDGL